MNKVRMAAGGVVLLAMSASAFAGTTVRDYEDLTEAFYGTSFHHQGITYHDVNQVSGVFPDGETFGPQIDEQVIVENATVFYVDFPTYGSPNNVLTFGSSFINGDNVSIGRVSSVTMDLDDPADFVSMDIAYLENGPWGGIVLHLDALLGGNVVGQDSLTISDLGGRDNAQIDVFSIGDATFDQLHLYATFGSDYSLPRVMIDDLTLHSTPAPACISLLALAGMMQRRRRA